MFKIGDYVWWQFTGWENGIQWEITEYDDSYPLKPWKINHFRVGEDEIRLVTDNEHIHTGGTK